MHHRDGHYLESCFYLFGQDYIHLDNYHNFHIYHHYLNLVLYPHICLLVVQVVDNENTLIHLSSHRNHRLYYCMFLQ